MEFVCYLNPKKSNAAPMLQAFADGAKARGHSVRIVRVSGPTAITREHAVFYGVDEVTLPTWQAVQREKQPFIYIDNGYFESKWKGGAYYRITAHAMQHLGNSPSTGKRWGALALSAKPTRAIDGDILIALQSDFWYTRFGTTKREWLADVQRKIAPYLGTYKAVARDKSEHKTPIDWEMVRAVVTHSSNVAVDGMLEGVPCFVTYPCAALTVAGNFPMIDLLYCPTPHEVLPWCWSLADNQWTVDEISAGKPFEVLTP